MKPVYFPERYPDELLYGILSRYVRHVGTTGPHAATEELFGQRGVIASYDLPGYLGLLAGRLDPKLGLGWRTLLDEHTLFPYYVAFQQEPVRNEIRETLRTGAADVHLRLGLAAFRIPRPTRLRFCPTCIVGATRNFGEPYWRRAHQLPGCLVCPDHGDALRLSSVDLHALNRHQFVAAGPNTCRQDAPLAAPSVDTSTSECLFSVAQASAALLKLRDLSPDVDLSRAYRDCLGRAGFLRSEKRIDQPALEEAFLRHYGGSLNAIGGVLDADGTCAAWLPALTRKHRKAIHPLFHILLDQFLAAQGPVASPGRVEFARAAFGKEPWRCRNPLAAHVGEPVVQDLILAFDGAGTSGVFRCGCGYVYRRALRADGTLGAERYVEFGPTLATALPILLANGASLRSVARSLRLDPKTLQREAISLGVQTPWGLRPSGKPRLAKPARYINLRKERVRAPDKQPRTRRDWAALDLSLVRQLGDAAQDALAEDPPCRVTMAELDRRLGPRGWLAKRSKKLPMACAEARRLSELDCDFQARRARAVFERLSRDGKLPAPWTVMRVAGLRGSHLPMIKRMIEAAAAAYGSGGCLFPNGHGR